MPELPDELAARLTHNAGDWLTNLLRDEELIRAIVEPRVRQMIMRGDLVSRDRLQVGAAIELAPLGLEQAARAVVEAARDIEIPELGTFTEALGSLILLLDPTTPDVLVDVDEQPIEDAGAAPEPAPEPESGEEVFRCVICDVTVDAEQHLVSNTRWRVDLCKEHHASYDPKKQRKAS